eukprot:TRINITY_DN6555_c0_g1_i2.p1 TRINITY_DN6555_c0_g1~~TRINITY_DN6555_c0_g1_i2.p1  ORF type:complete len:694 (+),score=63.50 TRINITY_DN6555_c0_g1_i2:488-2569(+)
MLIGKPPMCCILLTSLVACSPSPFGSAVCNMPFNEWNSKPAEQCGTLGVVGGGLAGAAVGLVVGSAVIGAPVSLVAGSGGVVVYAVAKGAGGADRAVRAGARVTSRAAGHIARAPSASYTGMRDYVIKKSRRWIGEVRAGTVPAQKMAEGEDLEQSVLSSSVYGERNVQGQVHSDSFDVQLPVIISFAPYEPFHEAHVGLALYGENGQLHRCIFPCEWESVGDSVSSLVTHRIAEDGSEVLTLFPNVRTNPPVGYVVLFLTGEHLDPTALRTREQSVAAVRGVARIIPCSAEMNVSVELNDDGEEIVPEGPQEDLEDLEGVTCIEHAPDEMFPAVQVVLDERECGVCGGYVLASFAVQERGWRCDTLRIPFRAHQGFDILRHTTLALHGSAVIPNNCVISLVSHATNERGDASATELVPEDIQGVSCTLVGLDRLGFVCGTIESRWDEIHPMEAFEALPDAEDVGIFLMLRDVDPGCNRPPFDLMLTCPDESGESATSPYLTRIVPQSVESSMALCLLSRRRSPGEFSRRRDDHLFALQPLMVCFDPKAMESTKFAQLTFGASVLRSIEVQVIKISVEDGEAPEQRQRSVRARVWMMKNGSKKDRCKTTTHRVVNGEARWVDARMNMRVRESWKKMSLLLECEEALFGHYNTMGSFTFSFAEHRFPMHTVVQLERSESVNVSVSVELRVSVPS